MRTLLAAVSLALVLTACERRADTETGARERSGTDTLIQSERVQDTTVVQKDTNIDVDTVKKTDNIEDKKD